MSPCRAVRYFLTYSFSSVVEITILQRYVILARIKTLLFLIMKNYLCTMMVTYSIQVSKVFNIKTAVIVQKIYENQPHCNKAKLRLSWLSNATGLSLSTVHRIIKSLMSEGYLCRNGHSRYSFNPKFFTTFTDDYISVYYD